MFTLRLPMQYTKIMLKNSCAHSRKRWGRDNLDTSNDRGSK